MQVDGANFALAVAQIAIDSVGQAQQVAAAQAGLMKDALNLSGGLVVELLESMPAAASLGQNIDCYA
jgi:hypothetical protein